MLDKKGDINRFIFYVQGVKKRSLLLQAGKRRLQDDRRSWDWLKPAPTDTLKPAAIGTLNR